MTLAQLDLEQAWAGNVPSRWRWSRNKELLAESLSVSTEGTEELLSVSHLTGITPRSEKNVTMTAAESLDGYRLVDAGDLVINTMWAWMGALGVSKQAGIVSPAYGVYRPRPNAAFCPGFYDYLYRSTPYVMEMTRLSRGIWSSRLRIYPDVFLSMAIPVPPLEEQRAIADYLDRETARIDTLIEEQQRLIEMLQERRASAVRAVLLRGLDSDAPLRASGSELLGSIPSAWNMVPTRHLCTITTGDEDSGNATEDGAYPFFVRGREVLRSNSYAFDGEAVMTPGDGQGGTGKVFHYFDGKFQAHQRVYVFTDFHGIAGRYFYYYLSTFLRPIALAGSNTVTMESLRRPLLAGFRVAVPPLDEQARILGYLDEQNAKIDQLISETERFIKLSQERRAALITAAVTGQIDVREAA
ncbi:restriction endonuclease subunit S [Streptomyces halstedii]|uniref:restriction endonuclease subunit S n=1 Tax=Streptomyces TaxID=1883 RepID=UPI000805B960|nr:MULTISPECIES: restriction endonuclease subunit S [unclassified Streptomyces]MYR74905.1 restriction endonuclease subunit S [Streptomyces sp. SID4925]SBU90596.1 type I restriction enzyme, S subunit [Streptomyces sp. OspMP-M45]